MASQVVHLSGVKVRWPAMHRFTFGKFETQKLMMLMFFNYAR